MELGGLVNNCPRNTVPLATWAVLLINPYLKYFQRVQSTEEGKRRAQEYDDGWVSTNWA